MCSVGGTVATHTGTTDASATISGIGGQFLMGNLQQALNILGVKTLRNRNIGWRGILSSALRFYR